MYDDFYDKALHQNNVCLTEKVDSDRDHNELVLAVTQKATIECTDESNKRHSPYSLDTAPDISE
jgi:hypothetical protein